MTNSPVANDEDFLANCTTNAFFLADTRGLHWRKYCSSCINSTNTANDPVLAAYSLALKSDVLSVWRRIPLVNISNQELGTRLFDCTKELYIFWFGEEPVLSDVPGPNLQEVEYGSFESGTNPVTLDLFFKAIHNIIERNLLNGDFVRLGKWFTKPVDEDINCNLPESALAFNFSLFIHGESSVVATVDIQEKSCVRFLTQEDLHKPSHHHGANEGKVLLAPYGLNAYLTGHHLVDTDSHSMKLLDEWKKFFPANALNSQNCPSVVEITLGEIKMLYPAGLVLMPLASKSANPMDEDSQAGGFDVADVIDHCWKCSKEKEELHSPTTQLWDFKPNTFQSTCSCSSTSNTTRVKTSGMSSFTNTNLLQSNAKNNQSNAKLKKDIKANLVSFHERQQKVERLKGRSTPSLLTGRSSTPLLNTITRSSTPLLNIINKPAKANNEEEAKEVVTTLASTTQPTFPKLKVEKSFTTTMLPTSIMTTMSSKCDTVSTMQNNRKVVEKEKLSNSHASISKGFCIPSLPVGGVDPRLGETFHIQLDLTEVKMMEENIIHQQKDTSILVRDVEEITIKTEDHKPVEVQPPKRTLSRSRSNKRPVNILSPSSIPEDVTSPIDKRSRRNKDSPITSPTLVESPAPSGPGRPVRRASRSSSRNVKTPITPKTENTPVTNQFNFNPRNSIPFPSPPPSHFSPTIKTTTSLTSTKDLVPISADLDNLFDDDEDETTTLPTNIKKPVLSPSVNIIEPAVTMGVSLLPPPSMTDHPHMDHKSSTTTLTQQDLAHMFPTPPSPPNNNAMSPTMSTHSDIHITSQVPTPGGACMEVLSPEMQHAVTVSENDHLEINLEARSPVSASLSTFSIPTIQMDPVAHLYTPLTLPSDRLKLKRNILRMNNLKYTPTWDSKYNPPVLYRRPSNNRMQAMSNNMDFSTKLNKLDNTTNFSPSVTKQFYYEPSSNQYSPIFDQGSQSLMVNLTLADSFMNWININHNALYNAVQDETFKLFKNLQNLLWRTSILNTPNDDYFPEDISLPATESNILTPLLKTLDSINPPTTEISVDLFEVLLKQLRSPFSMHHFLQLHDTYYKTGEPSPTITRLQQISKQKILWQLQRSLQQALQHYLRKSVWDSPKIEGPLSFQRINSICNKTGYESVSSSSSLLLNYDGDVITLSPAALKHWQTLYLQPYSGQKNIAYIVAIPDCDFIVKSTKEFFKEYNSVYESLNLGTHSPIVKDLRDGLIRINQKSVSKCANTTVDDWFTQDPSKIMAKMKIIAQFCKHQLGPYVSSLSTLDASLFVNKSDAALKQQQNASTNPSLNSNSTLNTPWATVFDEPIGDQVKALVPTVVIYIVDPFHNVHIDSYPALWSYVGLVKCFIEMCSNISGKLKDNVQFQIIPLEQILQVNLSARSKATGGSQNVELKNLALSVYSQCCFTPITNSSPKLTKYMTCFGIGNSRENLIRRRQGENNLPTAVYAPPFILGESTNLLPTTSSNPELTTALSLKDDSNILFCCYCLSRDNQWLIVSCTDQYGELHETTLIKILYPKRKKQKHMIWCVVLRKLWEFINGIVTYTVAPWKVVLTKFGQIGKHELKELNILIDKNMQNIVPYHQVGRPISPLSEACLPCSLDDCRKGKSVIRSISLCTVELNTSFTFYAYALPREINTVYSRIYVAPSPKSYSGKKRALRSMSTDLLVPESTNLMTSAFDDDPHFLPLSPTEHSIFQTSPNANDKLLTSPQNVVSPPNMMSSSIPRMISSPFQPISNKQNFISPVKTPTPTTDSNDASTYLCIGYLLSGTTVHQRENHNSPEVLKSVLFTHVTSSGESSIEQRDHHPLDSKNKLETLRFILERFDALSWLTVNAGNGERQSALPVHIRTLIAFRDVIADMVT